MNAQDNLLIRNENIQHIFNWYCDELFIVNRKYQRKLVWTLEEKQKFIESIALSYPVPLILLAKTERNGKVQYEIIDGMQRLDAIFSFICGDFPVKIGGQEVYFDSETMAKSKQLTDSGFLSKKLPVISRDICTNISNYQLPLSITNFDNVHVEEIFRRINATGRQLSDQDLRQAGATGAFSDLVRKLAANIRRDSSPGDVLELSKMKEISLSNRELPYGINLHNVFWVRQGIISIGNMRISRDEELVAYILTYILLGKDVAPTAKVLNIIYGYDDNDTYFLVPKTISAIEKIGEEKIISSFMTVFDEIEKMFAVAQKTFNELLYKHRGDGKPRSFQVVFLAIYTLITDGKEIEDYTKLIFSLDGLGNRLLRTVAEKWDAYYRYEHIMAIRGVIEAGFADANRQDPTVDLWVSKLENLLMQSKIEQQLFDFKIGLHNLDATADFNPNCLKKIVKTLTAIANTAKGVKGYVVVGIADKTADYELYKKLYNQRAVIFNEFHITGVQSEAHKRYRSMDAYYDKVKRFVENEPIDEETKSYILRFMRFVNYYDKSILVFSIESFNKPLLYDDFFYERRGTSVEKVEGVNLLKLMDRFK